MGYYIRVLAEKNVPIHPSRFRKWLVDKGFKNIDVIVETDDEDWQQVVFKRKRGKELFVIEKNQIAPGSLGAQEIQEFMNEIQHSKPVSAAKWLRKYLPKVKIIYAFQILFGNGQRKDWDVLHAIESKIWNVVGGILQADNEGFSNKDGYHILWQFSDHVKGPWNMAVLTSSGKWKKFQMDRGNLEHRKEFQAGRVPKDSKPVEIISV